MRLVRLLQGFPGGSVGKEFTSLCGFLFSKWGKPEFDPWLGKITCRREWQRTPVFWPGEFQGLHPWGGKESDMTEWLSLKETAFHSKKKKRNLLPSNRNYHIRTNSLRMTQTNSTQRMDFTFSRHLNMCCTILCLSMIWEERRELSEEG